MRESVQKIYDEFQSPIALKLQPPTTSTPERSERQKVLEILKNLFQKVLERVQGSALVSEGLAYSFILALPGPAVSRRESVRAMTKKNMKQTAASEAPHIQSGKESRRFIRSLVWLLIIGSLFLGGQGLRCYFNFIQLAEIREETGKLYRSVLGDDIGGSPYGRLQFEHGKLLASKQIALPPLAVLASLSVPARESLRLDGMTLKGTKGRVQAFLGAGDGQFKKYLTALSDDEQFLFSLHKREDVDGGIIFSLNVEPK